MNNNYIASVKKLSRDMFSGYEGNADIKITEVKDKITKCPACNQKLLIEAGRCLGRGRSTKIRGRL
jgi:hypothetical protein